MTNKITKKHRFNAVDAVIIIAIIAIIGVAVMLFTKGEVVETAETVQLEYVVEIKKTHNDFVGNFKVGDQLIDSVKKYNLGTVVAVDYENAVFAGVDLESGKATAYDYPDHSKVILTIQSEATVGAYGRYVVDGGYDISTGTMVYIRLPDFTGIGYCTSFRETEVTAE